MGCSKLVLKSKILTLVTAVIILYGSTSFYTEKYFAATRVYFPASGTAAVTPTVSANWTSSGSAVLRPTLISDFPRTFTSPTTTTIAVDNSSGTASTLFAKYVSDPLSAQTISGNVDGQFLMSVSGTTGCTAISKIVITVIDPLGNIVATIYNSASGSSNLTTTLTNRFTPTSTALTSYTCNTGDRLCFEIGIVRTAGTTARNGSISFGHANVVDLPVNETTQVIDNGWVEFSSGIIWNHGGI